MQYHAYNGFLQYVVTVDHPDNCPPLCECTIDPLPETPWGEGYWPFYLDDGWELLDISHN